MLTHNAIYYGYLKHEARRLNIKISLVAEGTHVVAVHIQDYVLYSFRDALACLQVLGRDVLTDVTAEELAKMNKKAVLYV